MSSESIVGGREMVLQAETLRQTIDVSRLCKTYERRQRDLGLGELFAQIRKISGQLSQTDALLFGCFMPIILADGLDRVLWLHPEFLPFVPVVVCIALSVGLLRDMR